MIGLFSFIELVDLLDYHVTAVGPEPCDFLSWDIGDRLYPYVIPILGHY